MERTEFASIVPKIKIWETKLLSKSFYEKLIESSSLDEALVSLQGTIYGDYLKGANFETGLNLSYSIACKELNKTMKYNDAVKLITLKNDYHNIKTLIKAKILNRDFSYILNENGTIDLDKLKVLFNKDDFRDLPIISRACIEEALKDFELNKDIQKIDIIVDKYLFNHMKEISINTESKYLINYVNILIDLTNFKTTLRIKKLNKDKSFLKEVLLENGKMTSDVFIKLLSTSIEDIPNKFIRTNYGKIITDSISDYKKSNSLGSFERNIDNFIMKYIREAKFVSLGAEPIFAYLYARETEIKNLRIILAGKLNGVDSKIIRERLRDNYV